MLLNIIDKTFVYCVLPSGKRRRSISLFKQMKKIKKKARKKFPQNFLCTNFQKFHLPYLNWLEFSRFCSQTSFKIENIHVCIYIYIYVEITQKQKRQEHLSVIKKLGLEESVQWKKQNHAINMFVLPLIKNVSASEMLKRKYGVEWRPGNSSFLTTYGNFCPPSNT